MISWNLTCFDSLLNVSKLHLNHWFSFRDKQSIDFVSILINSQTKQPNPSLLVINLLLIKKKSAKKISQYFYKISNKKDEARQCFNLQGVGINSTFYPIKRVSSFRFANMTLDTYLFVFPWSIYHYCFLNTSHIYNTRVVKFNDHNNKMSEKSLLNSDD